MRPVPPPSTRFASLVHAALALQVTAVAALTVFEQVRGRRLAREIMALGGDPRAPGAQALGGAVTTFAVLVLAVAVTTAVAAVAYLAWLVRATRNAGAASGAPAASRTPAGSRAPSVAPVVAGWLVPGLNLVAPPVLLDRVWRDSRPQADHRGRWLALLAAWWLSCLAALVLLLRLPFVPGGPDLTGIGPAELAAVAAAALLCGLTVRRVTRIQTESALRFRTTAGRFDPELPGLAYQGF
ncbi:DUF4328 domain-containing protein [Planomonospora corallina]|uniref:DUF4328 domain-containing protein n=1 Tax=Planomonospora corallina TaxID=1806052 RepID=A0ABV8IH36_9ACTN